MVIYIKKSDGLSIPKTGSEFSAGYDIVATSGPIINGSQYVPVGFDVKEIPLNERLYESIDYVEYKTGVLVEPQPGVHTYIFPRSSISKYNLSLCNSVGLIDNDYRGEIGFRFKYVIQPEDLIIKDGKILTKVNYSKIYVIGERIGQMVASFTHRLEFVETDELNKTVRGMGGFGSTGSNVKNEVESFKTIINTLPESMSVDQLVRISKKNEIHKFQSKEIDTVEQERENAINHESKVEFETQLMRRFKEMPTNSTIGYEKMVKERDNQQ